MNAQVKSWITRTLPFVVALSVWQILSATEAIGRVFLPSPGGVAQSFRALLTSEFLSEHLLPSAERVGAAFSLSTAIAFPIGMMAGQIQTIANIVRPACSFFRYLPVAAFVPLCILWFGIGDEQKIAVITIGVVFQLVLLMSYDSASVPREFVETARTFGLSRFDIIRRIVVPAAAPASWDHLRVAAGWAWSYVVLAELVAGNSGLGYFVIQSQRYLETERVFAGILVIGLVGATTDLVFRLAGERLFRWA